MANTDTHHPADINRDFHISVPDLLACAGDWLGDRDGVLAGVPDELRKFYVLRAAVIVAARPDGAYFDDEVNPRPHNWQPDV